MTEQQWPPATYRPVPEGGPSSPLFTQTTVDCDDPHAQAVFWAVALGYLVEDNHDFVEDVSVAVGVPRRHHRLDEVVVVLHQVAQGDRVRQKNSWHLDLNVGRENIDTEVARLTALGATERYRVDEPSGFHTTMADPEDNLFCVQ